MEERGVRVVETRLLILGDARKMSEEERRGRINLVDWLVGDATMMPEEEGRIILLERMFEAAVILLLLSPCSSLRFTQHSHWVSGTSKYHSDCFTSPFIVAVHNLLRPT